jgi:hypothetical protein
MRDSADIETQCILAVDLDERRPALRPFRQLLEKRLIPGGIGGNRDQRRIQSACIGQPRSGSRAAFRSRLGDGMDDRSVGALDGQDDRRVRR